MTINDWVAFAIVVIFGLATVVALAATAYNKRGGA